MVEELSAQPEHHPLADSGEAADEHALKNPADGGDAEVDRDDHGQVVLIAGANALVDGIANQQPAAGLTGGVAGRHQEEQEGERPVSVEVAPEPLHAATSSSRKSSAKAPPASRR